MDNKDDKSVESRTRDLLTLLKDNEYYKKRREAALKGENVEEFVDELESLLETIWDSLYDCTKDIERLQDNLKVTEDKSSKLQDMVIQQLFDSVEDGVTN